MSSSEDELRPVTVLFADVVGSTALAERLPPDEAKALIGECVNQMSRAVHEYGGTVQAYMGDGICAYFGVPVAREDDPERAARTALRILEVVRDYARDVERAWGIEEFDVRVGINAGPAAVGVVGDVDDEQTVAFGDTTNVAARLQSLAAPGTIVVGEEAARRLAHRFELEPIGRLAVRGRTKEVEVQQLVQPLQRDEARPRRQLVGRAAEAERLSTVARELASGRGQVLLLVGDAGIGKTRLVEELRSIVGEEAAWLEGHCLSYGGLPNWPYEEMLRRWLGIADEEPEIATRTKVRARLGALLGPRLDDVLAPLGRLLRVRLDPDRSPVAVREEPPEAIHEALHAWIEALARTRPVVVVLEDLHWALPDAREAAESLLDLPDRAAVLLVATLRADPGSEAWRFRLRALGDFAHRTSELRLDPLTDAEATQLVRTLAAGSIDEETIASAVARAEGNPLFLEELVRLLLEGSALQRRRTWTLTVGQTELPARLENLLVARVDALPDAARRLAQVAAVIGRTFEVPLLERVAGTEDSAADMLALVRGDIVRELRRYPDLVCEFRHGLLHEAALSTLTPPRHRELAGRVGAALEELLGARAGDEAERLAHYYVRSDRLDKAVAYLERAADDAGDSARRGELLEAARKAAARQGDVDAERRFEARLAELSSRPGGQLA